MSWSRSPSLVPAAATIDRFHAIRLAPFAVLLLVLAIPAVEALRDAAVRTRRGRYLVAALAALAAAQFAFFVDNYVEEGPRRTGRFEAAVPGLLDQAWANGGTVYIDYDDREPQGLAGGMRSCGASTSRGSYVCRTEVSRRSGRSPSGGSRSATTFVSESPVGDYWIALVRGPRS